MTQNTSTAVMQRRIEPHDSLDDFPTPPWATRAIIETIMRPRFGPFANMNAWEPACNRGHMAKPLAEYFKNVKTSDIFNYGWEGQQSVEDFLFSAEDGVDWILSNPPFRLAEQFIRKALDVSRIGCAFIVRSAFLEGGARYENLFSKTPPNIIAQHVERVPMVKGKYDHTASSARPVTGFIKYRLIKYRTG